MRLIFTNILNNTATILLYKQIGVDENGNGIDGAAVASEINYLNEFCSDSVKNINVRINSVGGSVQDGLSICSSILNSTIPVTTCIDGMAYSIAGVIAMCGSKRQMSDYATFMLHEANGNTNQSILDIITNSLAKIFERTTSLTLDKCKSLMQKETWMDASECLEMGFVDSIIVTTNKKPKLSNTVELYEFYNTLLTKKNPMNKLTDKLKLENNASEESIIEKVVAIEVEADTAKAESDALKVENENLKAKLKAFEDAELAKEVAAKEVVVKEAVTDGKITEESSERWMVTPVNSVELKNLFDSMKSTPVFVNVLEEVKKQEKVNGEDRAAWTYSDWERKDSKGLAEIQNNNPVEFERLISTINTNLKSKK